MTTKKQKSKPSKAPRSKTFATTKEINKATDKVITKYAEAIKRLADR